MAKIKNIFCIYIIVFCNSYLFSMNHQNDIYFVRTNQGESICLSSDLDNYQTDIIQAEKSETVLDFIFQTPTSKRVPIKLFLRNSNKLLILGPGYRTPKEKYIKYAQVFHDYDVVLFDFEWPCLSNITSNFLSAPIDTMFLEHKQVVLSLVNHFKTVPHKPYDQIIGLGTSYSAMVFLEAQYEGQQFKTKVFDKLILDSCPVTLADIVFQVVKRPSLMTGNACVTQKPGFWSNLLEATRIPALCQSIISYPVTTDMCEVIASLDNQLPILFIHGKLDQLVPFSMFNKLWTASVSTRKIALITPLPHASNLNIQCPGTYKAVCDTFIDSGSATTDMIKLAEQRPRIVIFTSNGGGGHKSATEALKQYLGNNVRIECKNILDDTLPMGQQEELYNTVMKCDNTLTHVIPNAHIINAMYQVGKEYYALNKQNVQEYIAVYLSEPKPNLVISVIPLINDIIYEVTKNLNIPFLLSPTDLDATTFMGSISKHNHPCFKFNLLFPDEKILSLLKNSQICPDCFECLGFPLRNQFYEQHHHNNHNEHLALHTPKILLMMGAQGSAVLAEYVKQLMKMPENVPFRLAVCMGSNAEKLLPALKSIKVPSHIECELLGRTEEVASLMATSDLFITKSGTGSFCEAIAMKLPMLLDATSQVIQWEQFNHDFVKRNNLGDIITSFEDVVPLVSAMLHNNHFQTLRHNFDRLAHPDTPAMIASLIQRMIARQASTCCHCIDIHSSANHL